MKRLFLIPFLFTIISLFGCKDKVKPGTAEVKRPVVAGVTVTEIKQSPVDEYYETSGTVKAKATSVIASKVMGTIVSLMVGEGTLVKKGQVLLVIDDRDMAQKVIAAEKAVEAAEQNKSLMDITSQRYRKLYDEKALTQQEMDQIEAQRRVSVSEYERAHASLAEAKVYHGFTRVTAPFSGVVTERKTDQGSMAVPGMPLLTVEDTSSQHLEVYVDGNFSGKLKAGLPVDITIDSPRQEMKGAISEIVPAVDPMSRTFLVKIALSGKGLRSGLYARARIPVGRRETILLPRTAMVEKGQLSGVYTVNENGVITYRLVRAGKGYNSNIEILSGINPKDKVITAGVEKAVDGGILQGAKVK